MLVHHGLGLARLKEDLYRFQPDSLDGKIAFDQTLVVTEDDWAAATKAAITVSERLIELELHQQCAPASTGVEYWQSWHDSGVSAAALLWIRPRIFTRYATTLSRFGVSSLRVPRIPIDTSGVSRFLFSVAKWISLNYNRIKLLVKRPILAEIESERERSFVIQRSSAKKIGAMLLNPWNWGQGETYEDVVRQTLNIMMGAYGLPVVNACESPSDAVKKFQQVLDAAAAAKPPVDVVPPLWQRWWPVLVIGAYSGLSILGNWQSILEWLRTSVVETVQAFFVNWVVSPMHTVYNTIRHDPNSTVALMGKQSLVSDLDSLERMVTDFVLQQGLNDASTNPADLALIQEAARQGDLTPVLRVYEKQIQTPIKSLVTGGLLRTMSIQIQKAKVDAEITVAGIDKLLQSQQLVFGLIALLPGLFVVQRLFGYVSNILFNRPGRQQLLASKSSKERLMVRLGNIEEIAADRSQLDETDVGLVYTEITLLKAESKNLLSARRFRQFCADLDRLIGMVSTADIRDRLLMLYAKAAALESSNK